MGNQLVGIAPSQIYPVEHYLTEHPELQFDISLGSTRFFKVARAKSQEGLIVAKVFAIHDPTLPLSTYKDKLEDIRIKLASAVNCLPFQRAVLTEKAGVIMREYVKYSLYDRISTRPFLSLVEKKWIAFQLLYALHQCHKVGVCHGDIKLENIMITSWNWILLTDFASFKPTYLPEDNPADFSYFFDTSRRRTCYIAPERFIKTLNSEISSQLLLPEEDLKKGDLTPAMDIFSAGCALTELFNEGHPPFDFSQLLAYRNGEYSAWKHLEKIEDTGIRELLRSMMEKDASLRLSAEVYLDQQRGKVFPEYFYSFLQSYMLIFSAVPIISLDEKVSRLKKDIKNIVKILKPDSNSFPKTHEQKNQNSDIARESEENEKEDKERMNNGQEEKEVERNSTPDNARNERRECENSEGLIIVTSLATSCVRGIHHCNSKLSVLEVLLELSAHTSSETVLDRILPYIFHLLHDQFPRVRVMAIHTLTKCLSLVKNVPCSDANIFPEYVLPNLTAVIHDEAVMVRAAYAENIAQLATTALRFLEQSQLSVSDSANTSSGSHRGTEAYSNRASNAGICTSGYDSELQTLHQMIQDTVATLLTDPENLVKRTLVENGITQLCVFFGKQKANDVLLSHMITFLNDKEDRHLRGSFFDCIVGVAAYVGCHSSPILCPLLQQGLTDLEEFVVTKAINAMTALAELSLLQKPALYELLKETTCFLVHPNLWIRHAIVGFISAIARTLNLVDVQCKVMAVIQPYLRHPVIQIDKEVLLLNALKPPVPRVVYDSVIRCPDIVPLLQALAERHTARCTLAYLPPIPMGNSDPSTHTSLRNLFRRLSSEGMTEEVEAQLIAMGEHLKKINRHHRASSGSANSVKDHSQNSNRNVANGKIELCNLKNHVMPHVINLNPMEAKGDATALVQNRKNKSKKGSGYDGHTVTMNEEWRHMFGTSEPETSGRHNESGSISPVRTSSTPIPNLGSGVEANDQTSGQESSSSVATLPSPPASEPTNANPLVPSTTSGAPTQPTITSSTSSSSSSPHRSSEVDHSIQEHSYIQYRCAPCKLELRELLRRKQEQQVVALRGRDWAEQSAWEPQRLPPPGWRLRGNLVAHLHEHRGAINRLVAIPETPLFASCSSDGCIRIWDCGKMEGRNIANRSRQVYNRQGGPLVGLTTCENYQSLASASHSGGVFVLRIEANSNKMAVLHSRQLDLQEEGCAVDISHFEFGSQSVLVYATLYGSIVGWDLRCPGNAWKLENDLRLGVITSLCVDSHQSWITVGTSSGFHVCWDLRFQLPISTIVHPSRARVRRLVRHPVEQSWVVSAVQGHNEISLWDLETQSRRAVLWASPSPPLSQTQMSPHSVCTMAVGLVDRAPFLFAGGTDMRLRHWDLESPSSSCIAIPAASDLPHVASSVSYESRLIDGTNVVVEVAQHQQPSRHYSSHHHQPPPSSSIMGSAPLRSSSSLSMGSMGSGVMSVGGQGIGSGQDCPRPGPEQPPAGHHDWISDVALCQATQCFLLTGSRDGVIKVWK